MSGAAKIQAPRGTETILVVEDEISIRKLLCESLRSLGYDVLEAGGPDQALFHGESARTIHLVISDVMLPGVSGHELTRRLLAMRPGMKVLYMSGHTGETVARAGILDAGAEFIQKPFSLIALGQKVRDVLENRRS